MDHGVPQMVSREVDAKSAIPGSEHARFPQMGRAIIGLLDFVICVVMLSLFFQGTVPGMQALKEAFRQIYSFMIDPDNLLITGAICIRLTIYGFSRCLGR